MVIISFKGGAGCVGLHTIEKLYFCRATSITLRQGVTSITHNLVALATANTPILYVIISNAFKYRFNILRQRSK